MNQIAGFLKVAKSSVQGNSIHNEHKTSNLIGLEAKSQLPITLTNDRGTYLV